MGYIGQPLNHGNLAADVFSGDGSTTGFTLSYSVGSANSISIYIDGVKQAVSTYTASGTTLTFTTAPPSGTNNIEVIFLALEITLPTPGDNTVTSAKIVDGTIVTGDLSASAGITSGQLAGSITYDKMLGTDRPCFYAYNSASASNGTGNNTTWVLDGDSDTTVGVAWATRFDQNSDFDTTAIGSGSTGGIFTAPVTGRYLFTYRILLAGFSAGTHDGMFTGLIASNASQYNHEQGTNAWLSEHSQIGGFIVDMDAGDTCYLSVRMNGLGSDTADISNGSLTFQGCLLA